MQCTKYLKATGLRLCPLRQFDKPRQVICVFCMYRLCI